MRKNDLNEVKERFYLVIGFSLLGYNIYFYGLNFTFINISISFITSFLICIAFILRLKNTFINTLVMIPLFVFLPLLDYYHLTITIIEIIFIISKIKINEKQFILIVLFWLIMMYAIKDVSYVYNAGIFKFESVKIFYIFMFYSTISLSIFIYYYKSIFKSE